MSQEQARHLRRPDGARIDYRITEPRQPGEAPALLLIHGLASNLTRWSEFVEHTRLTRTHPVIRLDLRGHGGSLTRDRIGLDLWCDDLSALLDATGQDRALVIGHSLGAQVALHFAARAPQRVAGIGLIDPTLDAALHGRWRLLRLATPLLAASAAVMRGLNALGLYRRALPQRDLRELDRQVRLALQSGRDQAAFIRQYSSAWADLRHVPLAVYLQDLVELFRPTPLPQTLGIPVLVLLSTAGTFADPRQTAALLGGSPAVQVRLIHCHHWPLTERPEEVRGILEDWCGAFPHGAAGPPEPDRGLTNESSVHPKSAASPPAEYRRPQGSGAVARSSNLRRIPGAPMLPLPSLSRTHRWMSCF